MKREFLLLVCLLGGLSAVRCGAAEDDPGTPLAVGGTTLQSGSGGWRMSSGAGGFPGMKAAGGSTGPTGRGGGIPALARGGNNFPFDSGTGWQGRGGNTYRADAAAAQCPAAGVVDNTGCQDFEQNQECPGPGGVKCTCSGTTGRPRTWACLRAPQEAGPPSDSGTKPADSGVLADRVDPTPDAVAPEPDVITPPDGAVEDASTRD